MSLFLLHGLSLYPQSHWGGAQKQQCDLPNILSLVPGGEDRDLAAVAWP